MLSTRMTEHLRADVDVGPERPRSPRRFVGIDALRGAALFLVVFMHASSIATQDLDQSSPGLEALAQFFEPLRMPTLMFLSGLFVPQSLAKGTRRYFVGKLQAIAWPYFVWSALMLAFLAAISSVSGRVIDLAFASRIFYHPLEHTWFLAYLGVYFVLAWVTRAVGPLWPASVLLALSIVSDTSGWSWFFALGAFFMAGVFAGRFPAALCALGRSWSAVFLGVIAPSAALIVILVSGLLPPDSSLLELLAVPVVIVMAARAAGLRRIYRWARPLAFIGRRSIVFYLSHWPVVIITSQFLAWWGDTSVGLHTAITVVGSLAASTVMVVMSDRSQLVATLFRWPIRRWQPSDRPGGPDSEAVEDDMSEHGPSDATRHGS